MNSASLAWSSPNPIKFASNGAKIFNFRQNLLFSPFQVRALIFNLRHENVSSSAARRGRSLCSFHMADSTTARSITVSMRAQAIYPCIATWRFFCQNIIITYIKPWYLLSMSGPGKYGFLVHSIAGAASHLHSSGLAVIRASGCQPHTHTLCEFLLHTFIECNKLWFMNYWGSDSQRFWYPLLIPGLQETQCWEPWL